jgi:thiosulfate reductase/polysulfide reductase chain A
MRQNPAHEVRILKSTCRCGSRGCGVLVYVSGDRIVKVEDDPQSPVTHGHMRAKGLSSIQRVYHLNRLQYPMKRSGERGEGRWLRISWDEAFQTIARRLKEIKEKYGAEAVCFGRGTDRNEGPILYRLANLFGTPNVMQTGPWCFLPRASASMVTCGGIPTPDYEHQPRCIILWGSQVGHSFLPSGSRFAEAMFKGAKLIVVDPRFTDHTAKADIWLQIRPGTDVALALGMLNVIVKEELYDPEILKWTLLHYYQQLLQ